MMMFIEAFRISGYNESNKSFHDFAVDIDKLLLANDADDERDDNKDGIPDVCQIPRDQLAKRKATLVMQNIDIARVTDSINGLSSVTTRTCICTICSR
jgi:hypothetical protein